MGGKFQLSGDLEKGLRQGSLWKATALWGCKTNTAREGTSGTELQGPKNQGPRLKAHKAKRPTRAEDVQRTKDHQPQGHWNEGNNTSYSLLYMLARPGTR